MRFPGALGGAFARGANGRVVHPRSRAQPAARAARATCNRGVKGVPLGLIS